MTAIDDRPSLPASPDFDEVSRAEEWRSKEQLLDELETLESQVRTLEDELAKHKQTAEQYRLFAESAPVGMFLVNRQGQIELMNGHAENLFGYAPNELIGQPIELLVPQKARAKHPGQREAYFAQPEVRAMGAGRELFGQRRDGSQFPIEIGLNPIRTGGELCALCAIVDITQRKHLEEANLQSALQFRTIFDQTLEFMGLLNPDGSVVDVNQPALDFRGLKLADVVGQSLWDTPWLDISDQARHEARQAIAAAASGGLARREMTINGRDGAKRTFDFSIKPVVGVSGQIELLLAEARDITEQKRLEEQLRQAQKMEAIGQLAGGVAHDFNNLLTIITGYSEMLLDSLPEQDPLREPIEEIFKAGDRSASLTRQLLTISRKQVLTPRLLDINDVIHDTEKMLRRVIGEDVELITVLQPSLHRVKADQGQLEQVLLNLAVNARDAMPQGGELSIETRNVELDEDYCEAHAGVKPGLYVVLTVTDSGTGMSKEVQQRIFEPFYTTKEKDKGTGLGLSVLHGIVKQSEGHCAVYSELGIGTSFKIYLPAIEPTSALETLPASAAPSSRGAETILLVEDEDGVRELVHRALERYGYSVLAATGPADAIRISQAHVGTIHLLVTDVMMPQLNGRRLAELLYSERPEMKVLYMSGYTDDAIVRQGILDAGISFLHKPFTPATLASKLREMLDNGIQAVKEDSREDGW